MNYKKRATFLGARKSQQLIGVLYKMVNLLLPLLTAAVPSIVSLFGGDEKDANTVNSVVNTAKRALGVDSDEELSTRLLNLQSHELDKLKLTLEQEFNIFNAEVQDRVSARAREIALKDSFGNKLMYFLASVVIIVNLILLVLAFYMPDALNNPGVMALVGSHTAAMTLVLSYFFGSSQKNHK